LSLGLTVGFGNTSPKPNFALIVLQGKNSHVQGSKEYRILAVILLVAALLVGGRLKASAREQLDTLGTETGDTDLTWSNEQVEQE